jgi:hypothetical protein
MKRIKSSKDILDCTHFAVIVYKTSSVFVPGDERSKECPGHGYPAHTEIYDTFEHWVTTDKQDLQKFIVNLDNKNKDYIFMQVSKVGKLKKVVNFDIAFED